MGSICPDQAGQNRAGGRRGPPLRLFRQLLAGRGKIRGYLSTAGSVHRDLKPGNVLLAVSDDGTQTHAKLVDFGVSRLLDSPQAKLDAGTSVQGEAEQLLVAARNGALAPTLAHALRQTTDSREAVLLTGAAMEPIRDGLARRIEGTLPLSVMPVPRPVPVDGTPPEGSLRRRSSDELTQAGMILGTLLYMAPELRGGANLANPSADIFSFGVMTYEVLTGTMPFDEIPLLRLHGSTQSGFKPLDVLCPGVSPELARTIEACLAMDPAGRPTAVDLVVAFSQALLPD